MFYSLAFLTLAADTVLRVLPVGTVAYSGELFLRDADAEMIEDDKRIFLTSREANSSF